MKKSEKASLISEILDQHYPRTPIPLDHTNHFTLLVAVLLSAQCTDERVNTVTPVLFKKAKNPKEMSKLSEQQIYKIIKPCGLGPKKSKAIKNLSKILVEEYDSKIPCDIDKLEKLPGVGHKTASVVISQGFGIPAFPVDTHIHRLAQRWGLTSGRASPSERSMVPRTSRSENCRSSGTTLTAPQPPCSVSTSASSVAIKVASALRTSG